MLSQFLPTLLHLVQGWHPGNRKVLSLQQTMYGLMIALVQCGLWIAAKGFSGKQVRTASAPRQRVACCAFGVTCRKTKTKIELRGNRTLVNGGMVVSLSKWATGSSISQLMSLTVGARAILEPSITLGKTSMNTILYRRNDPRPPLISALDRREKHWNRRGWRFLSDSTLKPKKEARLHLTAKHICV